MAKLKITIHPLFFIFGLYFAFIGKVFSFLIFTLTALIHEFGHFISSSKLGYQLNTIVLMPYGALLYGDAISLSYKDECKIALAGPLINFIIAIFFVALWWFFPSIYPYTELIVMANVSLCVINLLPCYPLDGGRFLMSSLRLFLSKTTAEKIVRWLGIIFSVLLFAIFVYSIFTTLNLTILFFSAFAFVGAISKNQKTEYVKIFNALNPLKLSVPKQVKKIAVNEKIKIKDLYRFLDSDFIFELEIYSSDGIYIKTLKGNALYSLLSNSSPYDFVYKK